MKAKKKAWIVIIVLAVIGFCVGFYFGYNGEKDKQEQTNTQTRTQEKEIRAQGEMKDGELVDYTKNNMLELGKYKGRTVTVTPTETEVYQAILLEAEDWKKKVADGERVEKGDWISLYESFVQDKIVFTPVMKKIFLTSGQETEQEKREFVMALFSIAAILPDTGLSFNMKGILKDKEWYGYWQTQNLRQYLTKSAAPVGNMLPVAIAWPLLSEFIQTTEQAINGQSDNRVDLRFAHAETVIPFVALMGIGKTDIQIASPDSVSIYWKDYEIAPMAANVQWVFYRDKNCQVWVKILLNEQEVTIPVVTSFFPYYRWEEVCHYLKQRIAISKEILSRFSSKTD